MMRERSSFTSVLFTPGTNSSFRSASASRVETMDYGHKDDGISSDLWEDREIEILTLLF